MSNNHQALAQRAAEEVMLVIERNRRIIKADIVEAILKALAVEPVPLPTFAKDAIDRMAIIGMLGMPIGLRWD